LEPDEAADVLSELEAGQASSVLGRLEDPEEIRPLLHPEDTAGGLMTSSFVALRRRMTAAEALAAIQALRPDTEEIYQLPVVDRVGKLAGVVSLRQLLQIVYCRSWTRTPSLNLI
jgi:magnesium transporter